MKTLADQLRGFMHKEIIFTGRPAIVACDGLCDKAWGTNSRPKVILTPGDDDDYFYVPDGELGEAPEDPGTYEGTDGKPAVWMGPGRINKWCTRECERSVFIDPAKDTVVKLDDFSRPVYNFKSRQEKSDREAAKQGLVTLQKVSE